MTHPEINFRGEFVFKRSLTCRRLPSSLRTGKSRELTRAYNRPMTSTRKNFPGLATLVISTTLLITLVSTCNLNEFGEPIQVKATFTLRVSATATPTFIPLLTATSTLTPLPPTEAPTQAPTETAFMGEHDMDGKIKIENAQYLYDNLLETYMLINPTYMTELLNLSKPITETGVQEEQLSKAKQFLETHNYTFPAQSPSGELFDIYRGTGSNTSLKIQPAYADVNFRNIEVDIYDKPDWFIGNCRDTQHIWG